MRRIASSLIVALLFLSLCAFAFGIRSAKALPEDPIVINPNGTISSPVQANITISNNETYTFTGNNYLPIVVQRSNITIDGAGYMIQGQEASLSAGVNLTGTRGVTIENVKITAFYYGIYLYSSSNCAVSGDNITANKFIGGIYLDYSPYNLVSGNNITNNGYYGLYLYYSPNCTVLGNNISSNWEYGLYLYYSSNGTVSKNTLTNNGLYVWASFHNNVVDNLVDGKPLVYLERVSDYAVRNAGQVVLIDCDNINVNNLNLSYATIELWQTNNTQIVNSSITDNWWDGVDIWYSSNCTVSGGSMTYNAESGVDLEFSPNCTVSNNNIANNGYGILLESSFDDFSGNTIINNGYAGIGLYSSYNCTVSGNMFTNDGLYVDPSFENTVANNLVNGKPLVYLEHVSGYTVSNAGQVVLVNCDNISVNNLNLSYTTVGVELWQTNDTRITGNNLAKEWEHGVWLQSSLNCTVAGNNMTNDGWSGVWLSSSSNCTVSRNNMANSDYGVDLAYSSNNNTISENIIMNNYCGVELRDSSKNNRFFHNDFDSNTQQVVSDGLLNTWDNGYPSGGNYWSNYRTAYPSAAENDSSAIWNTPYVIDSNNTDRYPLVGPFNTFGVGTWNGVAYSVDTVSNSTLSGFSFNPSMKTLTFNATGTTSPSGFCRITIPASFMSCNNTNDWSVTVNKSTVACIVIPSENSTYIYFTYQPGTETVQITSTAAATPEFQPIMLLPLFMIMTLLGAMIVKRKRLRQTQELGSL
ncbi:MAG TPA: right-handed parallel beta-helix repeat-containing protein [Candidatus Bathyarchaeia archaeon]|nr:right-handed parallel beta-helix repeat-containing protein [Candidatus Bathyarchaeia archaeon]